MVEVYMPTIGYFRNIFFTLFFLNPLKKKAEPLGAQRCQGARWHTLIRRQGKLLFVG